MARRRGKGAARKPEPAPSLVDRLEERERTERLASARAKLQRGATPNAAERRALREHERRLDERHGMRFLAACPKSVALDLLETQSKVVVDNRKRRGFPWPEGRNDPVDLRRLLRWLWKRFLGGETTVYAGDVEDVLIAGASQDLKDELIREKIRRERLGNEQKEIELERERSDWLPVGKARPLLMQFATRWERLRERVEKRLDEPDVPRAAREAVSRWIDETVDEFVAEIERELTVDAADAA